MQGHIENSRNIYYDKLIDHMDCPYKPTSLDPVLLLEKTAGKGVKKTAKYKDNTRIRACGRQLWRQCCQSSHDTQFPSRRRSSRAPDVLLVEHWFDQQVVMMLNKQDVAQRVNYIRQLSFKNYATPPFSETL